MYYVATIMTRLQNTKSENLYFFRKKKLFLIDSDRLNTVIFYKIFLMYARWHINYKSCQNFKLN